MMTMNKPSIEKHAYQRFMQQFKKDKKAHPTYRLGQAFYNHFKLHKLCDQISLGRLYELDGTHAIAKINELFKFN